MSDTADQHALTMMAWQTILGHGPTSPPSADVRVMDEEVLNDVRRLTIRYRVEEDEPTEAYLLEPNTPAPWPGVLVLHSTVDHHIRQPAGLEGPAEYHLGLHYARQGYACICPRNYLWGYRGSTFHDAVAALRERWPMWTGMAKMLWDTQRALDVLSAWPGVAAERLGAIGHSLGAKETLYVAAFDERVRAAVFSEGGIGIRMCNWNAPWYLGAQVDQPGFARDHEELLRLIAPRAFLLLAGNGTDGDPSGQFLETARRAFTERGVDERLVFLNHAQGHRFPSEAQAAADAWFAQWL